MPSFTVAELADRVRGSVEGDGNRAITGVAPVESAGPAELAFVTAPKYARRLGSPPPGALLLPADLEMELPDTALIRVEDPQLAFARLLPLYHPPRPVAPGVDASAILEPGVELGDGVTVGPHVVIRAGARIGEGTRVGAFSVIDREARIGNDCRIAHSCSILARVRIGDRVRLHPGVRVGTDGFGYAHGPDGAVKIPQVGGLRIGDDVEIGANSTIDRGALGDTVIGARTKIDNLVHIGHNVEIGEDCMIVAQVGVAGSVRIGRGAALAGQAGIAGHLTIGPGARIAAQAGVIGDVPAGASYSGYPARPHAKAMRASAALLRLPEALRRLRAVERRLGLDGDGDGGADEGRGNGDGTA